MSDGTSDREVLATAISEVERKAPLEIADHLLAVGWARPRDVVAVRGDLLATMEAHCFYLAEGGTMCSCGTATGEGASTREHAAEVILLALGLTSKESA
jgi:hypothetical protein